MRHQLLALVVLAPIGMLAFACTGEDELFAAHDAGTGEAGTLIDSGATDADAGSPRLACGDAAAAPPRLLAVQGNASNIELSAVNLATGASDGKFGTPGGYGTVVSGGTEPYLLAQQSDLVFRLDANEPWKVVSSWNVSGDDQPASGPSNANPSAIQVPACGKGYVLRFNRNKIAVVDTSIAGTNLAPSGWIDLTPLVDPTDTDKVVEMTAAIHVPSKKRLYVLLGNADLTKTAKPDPFTTLLLCNTSKSSIVAIDTETDQIVSLGGTAPGGGIALAGYNPPLGSPFWYDAARDRFIVLSAGCNEPLADGGGGAMTKRLVEEIDPNTGASKVLLDLNAQGFPAGLVYADEHHAAVTFFGPGYLWDPAQTSLGPAIEGGLDLGALASASLLVGTRATFVDGGPGPMQIVSAPFAGDGGSTVVGQNPFTTAGGYVAGLEVWPRR